MVWNTARRGPEMENLIEVAKATMISAEARKGIPRFPRPRRRRRTPGVPQRPE